MPRPRTPPPRGGGRQPGIFDVFTGLHQITPAARKAVTRIVPHVAGPPAPPPPRVPKSKPYDAAHPTPIEKWTTVHAAENQLTTPELLHQPKTKTPPPPRAPFRTIKAPPSKPTAPLNTRYGYALGGIVIPKQRQKLAETMSPARRAQLLTQHITAAAETAPQYSVPLTSTGKIDLHQIHRDVSQGVPGASAYVKAHGLDQPVIPGGATALGKAEGVARVVAPIIADPTSALGTLGFRGGRPTVTPGPVAQGAANVAGALAPPVAQWGFKHLAAPVAYSIANLMPALRSAGQQLRGQPPQLGTGGPTGSQLTLQQAGFAPNANDLSAAGQFATKTGLEAAKAIGIGLPGAVAGFALDPPHALLDTLNTGWGFLKGNTQLLGAGAALVEPGTGVSRHQRAQVVWNLIHGMFQQADQMYGPGVSVDQVWHQAEQHPGLYGAYGVMALDPALKGGLIGYGILGRGLTLEEAINEMRFPSKPREVRYQTPGPRIGGTRLRPVRGEPGAVRTIEIPRAKSPLTRWTIQKPYDVISRHVIQRIPGVRRLPISESHRFAHWTYRQLNNEARRLPAEMQGIYRDAIAVLAKRGKKDSFGTRLAVDLMRPDGYTDEEWSQAILADIHEMINGREFISAEDRDSPGVRRLLARMRAYDRVSDAARIRKRAAAARSIYDEQGRHAAAIDDLVTRKRELAQHRDEIAADDTLSAEERAAEIDHANEEAKSLDLKLKQTRQHLREVTVDQPAIDHANRTKFEQIASELPYFQKNPEDLQTVMLAGDAWARAEAARAGGSPTDFWARHEFVRADPNQIPDVAFGQLRGIAKPERFDAERDGKALLDKYTPVKKRGEDRPKIAGLPKTIKTRADFRNLLNDMAGRLEAGLPHAKEWYRESGREILAATGGDVDRADRVAQLTAIYSPQKPVAPNIALAMRVLDDYEHGRGIRYGNRHQKALARKAVKGEDWLASVKPNQLPKVRRFYANLLKHIDPTRMEGHGFTGREVTVDGWMGAAHGYGFNTGNSGLTEAQFRHVEDVIQQLADHYGIEPEEAQAAIWTSIKAERDRSTAKLYADPATRDEALQKSGQSFADAIFTPKNTLRLPLESMSPSKDWMQGLTAEQRDAHAAEYGNAALAVFHDEGFIARVDPGGISFWKNPDTGEIENNPAIALEIAMGDRPVTIMKGGEVVEQTARSRYLTIPPAMRETADGLAAALGDAAQQAQAAWARYLNPRGNLGDVTAYRLELGRALTDEEIGRLTETLHEDFHYTPGANGGIIAFNDPDSILDRSIQAQAQLKAGRKETAKAVRATLGREAKVRRARVDEAFKAALPDHPGTLDVTDLAHRGNLQDAADYQTLISSGRRSDLFQRVRDRLAGAFQEIDERYQADPVAAAERTAAFPGSHGLGAESIRGPPAGDGEIPFDSLAQTRQADLLGASQLLNSASGQRIIYLTEHSDASTLLHELFGHATQELHNLYPREFESAEMAMGKPYADWAVEDHEQFARWMERYFMQGYAPTPELVPVFDHARAFMRATYAGITKQLGKARIPPDVRFLFDTAFGGYTDETVGRIATEMGTAPWGHEDFVRERMGSAAAVTKAEAMALRKRVETRRYNVSLDGLVTRQDELTKKMDALDKQGKTLSPEEDAERVKLSAEILRLQGAKAMRKDWRMKNLSEKAKDLEKALAKPGDNRRYQGALDAARWMMADRERILRESLGDHYDEIFTNHTDQMADWLVSHGFLAPDFERGTASYWPMRMESERPGGPRRPAAPLEGQVIGESSKAALKLHHKNEMILWQNGNWDADPMVLMHAHMRASSYQFMNHVKQTLWDMGRPMREDERSDPTALSKYFIINKEGSAISPETRAALQGSSSTGTAHMFHDGAHIDDDMLENSLAQYMRNFAIDPKDLPVGFNMADLKAHPELRLVPKEVVHAIMRPLRGGRTGAGKLWDVANTFARFATIYANAPAYMTANLTNNVVNLLYQQGWRLPDMVARSAMLLKNARLAARIYAETGDLPAFAAISRGRELGQRVEHGWRQFEHNYLNVLSTVDRVPRGISWIYAARQRGYKTEADLFRLLDGKTAKAARDRELVGYDAANHMIDFNRLSDFEKQNLTRILFIWPFVRGATAWPFWYAKNYPGRTAALSILGQPLNQRADAMTGPRPVWYRDYYPVAVNGDRATMINVGSISTSQMAENEIQLIHDQIASAMGKAPDNQTANLMNTFAPFLRNVFMIAGQQSSFGKPTSLKDLFTKTIPTTMIPFYRLADSLLQWDDAAKTSRADQPYYDTYKDRAVRQGLRILPQVMSIKWLNEEAQGQGVPSFQQQVADRTAIAERDYKAVMKQPAPKSLRTQVLMKTAYSFQQKAQAKRVENSRSFLPVTTSTGKLSAQYTLSEYERAKIAYQVLKTYLPGDQPQNPDEVARAFGVSPENAHKSAAVNDALKRHWFAANWNRHFQNLNKVTAAAKRARTTKAVLKELGPG